MPAGRLQLISRGKMNKKYNSKTLSTAWKKHDQKAKGGLVTRTARANRRAIKQANKKQTYVTEKLKGLDTNNLVGQYATLGNVSNLGFYGPNLNEALTYHPAIMSLISIVPPGGPKGDSPNRSNDWITLKNITIKGSVIAGSCDQNTGIDADMPRFQTIELFLVLDRNPVAHGNPYPVPPATSIWKLGQSPFRVVPVDATDAADPINILAGTNPGATALQRESLLVGVGASSGGFINGKGENSATCFYNNDAVSNSARFKVLKRLKLRVQQTYYNTGAAAGFGGAQQIKCVKNFSFTHSAPYKFHFAHNKAYTPENQTIYLCAISNCKIAPHSTVDPPSLNVTSRVRFYDQ